MIMDTLRGVESFIRSVEEGSIAAAARRLGITPAASSQNIARLERSLGTRLLQRTTRQISLTEAGQGFHERVLTVLGGLEEAEAFASGRSSEVNGTLKISASTSFGRMHVAPHLKPFMEAHPDLYADTSRGARLAIREGVLDLGSVVDAVGLGAALEPDVAAMEPMRSAAWPVA